MLSLIIGILFLYFVMYKNIFAKRYRERTGKELQFWDIFNPKNWDNM